MPIAPSILQALLVAAAAFTLSASADEAPKTFSAAERALFMSDPLAHLQPPTKLTYRFRHGGSLEAPFEDQVRIALTANSSGACCEATGEYLGGEHRLALPAVDGATGNPAILFFLERDVREMQRLTQGKAAYFRQRIRMALFDGARERSVNVPHGKTWVDGQEFTIMPYHDDPNRPRFERLADKRYVFTLSPGVPGGVYSIRTEIEDARDPAHPLVTDDMVLDEETGAVAPGRPR